MKLKTEFFAMLLVAACVPAAALAEDAPKLEGVWDVAVTIQTCDPIPVTIRTVRAMNLFMPDGALTETAANPLRSNSLGQWERAGGHTFAATFRFFRYNQFFAFTTVAKVTRTITLSADGKSFTSTGTVEDFDPTTNKLIASSCAVETATRLE